MPRKLRTAPFAIAGIVLLLAVLSLLRAAGPLQAGTPADGAEAGIAPAPQAIQHGIAMPFFSFRPRS